MKNVLKMSVNVCVFDIKATCLENEIPILNNVVMMSLHFYNNVEFLFGISNVEVDYSFLCISIIGVCGDQSSKL